jgi:Zn finger protein HypA/HybF involved in hydrogenase expression
MKHTKETFRMKIPLVCPLLKCEHCGYKFILHGVVFSGKRHFDNRNDQVLQQDSFYFCPFCGRKNE